MKNNKVNIEWFVHSKWGSRVEKENVKMKKIITAKKKNNEKELIEELSDLEHEQ